MDSRPISQATSANPPYVAVGSPDLDAAVPEDRTRGDQHTGFGVSVMSIAEAVVGDDQRVEPRGRLHQVGDDPVEQEIGLLRREGRGTGELDGGGQQQAAGHGAEFTLCHQLSRYP